MNILFIEPDPQFARSLHAHLLEYRAVVWDLVHVTRIEEALRRVRKGHFDVILLSLEAATFDACVQLHSLAPNTPITILAEAYSSEEAVRSIESGAEDYVAKNGLAGSTLIRRMRLSIERARMRKRLGCRPLVTSREPRSLQLEACGQNALAEEQIGLSSDCSRSIEFPEQIRVLHVEDSRAARAFVRAKLQVAGPTHYYLKSADSLASAIETLHNAVVDVVLVDLTLPDGEGQETVERVLAHAGSAVTLVITCHEDDETAIHCIQLGAIDYLFKSLLTAEELERAIELALARKLRHSAPPRALVADRRSEERSSQDRRRFPRYTLSQPIYVVPVLPGNRPDITRVMDGLSQDVSSGGIALEIPNQGSLPGRRLVLGVESEDGVAHFATAEVRSVEPLAGRQRIGCEFVEPEQDVLREQNVMPTLDLASCRLKPALPTDVLHAWQQVGVLQRVVVNRVLLCPECWGLPTFRNGCPKCGSAEVASSRLIHHFACAYVGNIVEFEKQSELICPKCRARGMIAGTDFEYLRGPYRCLECTWSDTEMERVGQCLKCELRFPIHLAREEELVGYHVERLDPLALVGSS